MYVLYHNNCLKKLLSSRNVTLWKSDRSPACRAVMMALDAMSLSVNEVDVNMDRGEHRTPEMLMVPTSQRQISSIFVIPR